MKQFMFIDAVLKRKDWGCLFAFCFCFLILSKNSKLWGRLLPCAIVEVWAHSVSGAMDPVGGAGEGPAPVVPGGWALRAVTPWSHPGSLLYFFEATDEKQVCCPRRPVFLPHSLETIHSDV